MDPNSELYEQRDEELRAIKAARRNAAIPQAVSSLDAARNLLSANASDIAHSKRFVDDIDLMCAVLLSQVD